MSNATTPPRTFKGFVRQRDQDLSATDIADFATHMDREEATHSRKAKLQGLLGAALLAGVIAVRTSFVPGSMAAIDGLLIVLGVALVLAFIFMALTAMEASACGGEADRARRALKRLDGQDRLMREALSAGDSGAGFTLLLRSFDVEDRGSSAAEADAVNTSNRLNEQAYTSMSTSQGGGAVFLPPEFYVWSNAWTAQVAALQGLTRRRRVVLLENIALSDSKREELERTGATVVPVVLGDWYEVFSRLYAGCQLVIFFLDELSPALTREIDHALAHGGRYIVVCGLDFEKDAAQRGDERAQRLLSGAVAVVPFELSDQGLAALADRLAFE